jgi:hypothetical protein
MKIENSCNSRSIIKRYGIVKLPLTHNGGAPVAFATRKDIAISSQFLVNHLNYWSNNKMVGIKYWKIEVCK